MRAAKNHVHVRFVIFGGPILAARNSVHVRVRHFWKFVWQKRFEAKCQESRHYGGFRTLPGPSHFGSQKLRSRPAKCFLKFCLKNLL